MADTHWFDTASKVLTFTTNRRGIFAWIAALSTIIAYDQNSALVGKGDKRGKGKSGKKGNGKKGGNKGNGKRPTRKPKKIAPRSCSDGVCATEFSSQEDRDWCEFICRQCDGDDPREFCIVSEPLVVDKAAVCCREGARCCGSTCCQHLPRRQECCDGQCADTRTRENCGGCGNRCAPEEDCVDSRCIVQCDPPCSDYPGVTCCNGRCRNLLVDDTNCGACGHVCPDVAHQCIEGVCRYCPDGEQYCGPLKGCVPDHFVCCGPDDACAPPLPCCGTGDGAYCSRYVGMCVP
jgi:hypothetical protein